MLSEKKIKEQLSSTLQRTDLKGLTKVYQGRTKEHYLLEGKRFIITTDNEVAFDRSLTTIPFKGAVHTAISAFWFQKIQPVFENAFISSPHPHILVMKECQILPLRFRITRFLTDTMLFHISTDYFKGIRNFSGTILPSGLTHHQRLEKPLLIAVNSEGSPLSLTTARAEGLIDEDVLDELEEAAQKLFSMQEEHASAQALVLVDSEYTFGMTKERSPVLVDMNHEKSTFWEGSSTEKQEALCLNESPLIPWLKEQGFSGEGVPAQIPEEVRIKAAKYYLNFYEQIVGEPFKIESKIPSIEDAMKKIEKIA